MFTLMDYADESITLSDLRTRWEWDPLRNDPRFQKIWPVPEPKTTHKQREVGADSRQKQRPFMLLRWKPPCIVYRQQISDAKDAAL
jgi:hypothetical protein